MDVFGQLLEIVSAVLFSVLLSGSDLERLEAGRHDLQSGRGEQSGRSGV